MGGGPPSASGATGAGGEGPPRRLGGDTRTGSESAIDTVVESCTAISSSAYSSSSESETSESTGAERDALPRVSGS